MTPALFWRFVSVSFKKQVTYRFEYFTGMVNGFMYVFIFTSLWGTLFARTGGGAGFTREGIVAYAVLAMCVRIAFSMDDGVIPKKVADGSVSMDLIRPVSFFYMNLAESVGFSLFHLFARSLPIFVISALLFDVTVSPRAADAALFLVSAALGYLILFMINFSMGLLAFWFIEVFPFMLFKYSFITLFSGGILPIDFFPERAQAAVALMPFPYIFYAPVVILMGRVDASRALSLIGAQAAWAALLAVVCFIAWRAGQGRLVIQGG